MLSRRPVRNNWWLWWMEQREKEREKREREIERERESETERERVRELCCKRDFMIIKSRYIYKWRVLSIIDRAYIFKSVSFIGEKLTVTKHCWLYVYAVLIYICVCACVWMSCVIEYQYWSWINQDRIEQLIKRWFFRIVSFALSGHFPASCPLI